MTVRHLLGHMAGLSYGWSDHPVDEAYRRRDVSRGRVRPLQVSSSAERVTARLFAGHAVAVFTGNRCLRSSG